ncbi:MAG: RluA family pseudouridine synthase [Planctomycetes bacterium]|jgi:23S rRNA pseudouridine1911/1915/1917 synthase|nr:RluA family pseudouridine synthase [Planctomycetota bacterium]
MSRGETPAPDLELRSRVPKQAHGLPLLDYLLQRFRYQDRTAWLREFAAGRLLLDGRPAEPMQRLRTGAELLYRKQHQEPEVSRDVRVLHRARTYAIVEKPAHLPMHSDGPFVRNTLVHILRTGEFPQAELVHRLDRETSGLLVIAHDKVSRSHFERQFAQGLVAKEYLAVVRGVVPEDFTVDAPIGHSCTSSISLRRSAAPDALQTQPARTDFAIEQRLADRTLLRCKPHTGRTHQIRVHLEHRGFPLLGDKLYGRPDADYLAFVARVKAGGDARTVASGEPDRQLLHAAALTLEDPETGQRVRFTSPLPPDVLRWLPGA